MSLRRCSSSVTPAGNQTCAEECCVCIPLINGAYAMLFCHIKEFQLHAHDGQACMSGQASRRGSHLPGRLHITNVLPPHSMQAARLAVKGHARRSANPCTSENPPSCQACLHLQQAVSDAVPSAALMEAVQQWRQRCTCEGAMLDSVQLQVRQMHCIPPQAV